jgi:ribosome-binding protein aMBF1 (putative translation factor)
VWSRHTKFPNQQMVTDMGKKVVECVVRSKVLSAEEIARDREIRRKIQGEFPPKPKRAVPDSLSEALKRSIQASGMTVYEIAKRAGVSQIVISRFLSGERDIRMATADKLAEVLGLKLATS